MASLFERQRADVESRLDAIVRGGEPVTSRALASLQGALGLDDVILDDEGVPRDAPGSDTRALVEHALCRLTQRVMQEVAALLHTARAQNDWDLAVAELLTQVVVMIYCCGGTGTDGGVGDTQLDGLQQYLRTMGIAS